MFNINDLILFINNIINNNNSIYEYSIDKDEDKYSIDTEAINYNIQDENFIDEVSMLFYLI